MKFSRLRKAQDYEVADFLKDRLKLTDTQYHEIVLHDALRFTRFRFYKEKEIKKHNFLWRLTAPIFLIFCILVIVALPFKWLFTGNRYLPEKFLDIFYYRWQEKMGW